MPSPAITITGTFEAITGAATGYVTFSLQNYGNSVPTVTGGVIVNAVTTTTVGSTFSVSLFGNDVITPSSTFYVVSFYGASGSKIADVPYLFTGSGTYDISTLSSYTPTTALSAGISPVVVNPTGAQVIAGYPLIAAVAGLHTQSFTSSPTFNAAELSSFQITLTGNVTSSTVSNATAGQIITFVIIQDATGGHTFAFPANFLNASAVDATANAVNVQSFIFTGTNAYPISVMTIS